MERPEALQEVWSILIDAKIKLNAIQADDKKDYEGLSEEEKNGPIGEMIKGCINDLETAIDAINKAIVYTEI